MVYSCRVSTVHWAYTQATSELTAQIVTNFSSFFKDFPSLLS